MDIRAILKARNLDDASVEALMTNPAYSAVLESFITEAENGKTAYEKAVEIENNLKNFQETQVMPYVRAADEKVAQTAGELAQLKAHMKTLKERGYDIPDAYLEASGPATPPPAPAAASTFDPKIIDDRMLDVAKTNMALISMSNKYRKLTGGELDLDSEYEDFGKNRRPSENMREYVARKYDIPGLEAKQRAAVEQKKLDDYAASKIQEEKAKWTQANGANPDTVNPRSSRFDAIRQDEGRTKLWQTAQGRDQATKMRLEKYANGNSLVQ